MASDHGQEREGGPLDSGFSFPSLSELDSAELQQLDMPHKDTILETPDNDQTFYKAYANEPSNRDLQQNRVLTQHTDKSSEQTNCKSDANDKHTVSDGATQCDLPNLSNENSRPYFDLRSGPLVCEETTPHERNVMARMGVATPDSGTNNQSTSVPSPPEAQGGHGGARPKVFNAAQIHQPKAAGHRKAMFGDPDATTSSPPMPSEPDNVIHTGPLNQGDGNTGSTPPSPVVPQNADGTDPHRIGYSESRQPVVHDLQPHDILLTASVSLEDHALIDQIESPEAQLPRLASSSIPATVYYGENEIQIKIHSTHTSASPRQQRDHQDTDTEPSPNPRPDYQLMEAEASPVESDYQRMEREAPTDQQRDCQRIQTEPKLLRFIQDDSTKVLWLLIGCIVFELLFLDDENLADEANFLTMMEDRVKRLLKECREQDGRPTDGMDDIVVKIDAKEFIKLKTFFQRATLPAKQVRYVYCRETQCWWWTADRGHTFQRENVFVAQSGEYAGQRLGKDNLRLLWRLMHVRQDPFPQEKQCLICVINASGEAIGKLFAKETLKNDDPAAQYHTMASHDVRGAPEYYADQAEAEAYLKKHGLQGFDHYMKSKLNAWKDVDIHIGTTGESGCGKSTFINTLRGLRPTDEGAAKVGVKQTTLEPTAYTHPRNPRLIMWDLPGVNTPDFFQANYKEKVKFGRYDFFLIMSRGRFTENDLWLAKQVKQEKQCFFVRTHTDTDVHNQLEDYPELTLESIMGNIRGDCVQHLKSIGDESGKEIPIFLINARDSNGYEFAKLSLELINQFPDIKREAFVLTIMHNSRDIMEKKYEALQKRIWKVAALSGAIGLIPVPAVSSVAELAIITKEVLEYRDQFGLDEKSLERFKLTHKVPVEQSEKIMTEMLGISVARGVVGFVGILLTTQLMSTAAEEIAKGFQFLLPGIGTAIASVVGGTVSVVSTKIVLSFALNKIKKVSIALLEAGIKNTTKDIMK